MSQAIVLTNLMRLASEPFWVAMRACLVEKQIDPWTAVLAASFPDDVDVEQNVLVQRSGTVVTFLLRGGAQQAGGPDAWVVDEWIDITHAWQDSAYEDDVREACQLLSVFRDPVETTGPGLLICRDRAPS